MNRTNPLLDNELTDARMTTECFDCTYHVCIEAFGSPGGYWTCCQEPIKGGIIQQEKVLAYVPGLVN